MDVVTPEGNCFGLCAEFFLGETPGSNAKVTQPHPVSGYPPIGIPPVRRKHPTELCGFAGGQSVAPGLQKIGILSAPSIFPPSYMATNEGCE